MSIDINTIQMDDSRKMMLIDEFQKPYFQQIKSFLQKEKSEGKTIFPE
jgi:uracil-DNA glycosylase